MVKVPLSNSFLQRRDARRKFIESLGTGASLAPRTRQRISLGSENDWNFRLRSCQSWAASGLSLEVVVPTSINWYRMRYVGLGRDSLRSHFVFRPRHAPEWLRARFLPVFLLANEEELTGKTFTTSLNTTNPNTYVKFIFLRTSPLINFRRVVGFNKCMTLGYSNTAVYVVYAHTAKCTWTDGYRESLKPSKKTTKCCTKWRL